MGIRWALFDQLIELCNKADPHGAILEFGTGGGGTSTAMAGEYLGKIYTIDWYQGLPQTKKRAPREWSQGAFHSGAQGVLRLLAKYPQIVPINCNIFELEDPEVYGIPPIVGVHVDVDIYESAIASLRYLDRLEWKRLAIRFDDWGDGVYLEHEPAALSEWLEENGHKEISRKVSNVADNPGFGMRQNALVEVERAVTNKKRDEKSGKFQRKDAPATEEAPEAPEEPAEPVNLNVPPAKAGTFEALWEKTKDIGNPLMMSEEVARTIYDILQELKPHVAVEVGTHMGRSGSVIGLCLSEWNGKLISYDAYNPRLLSPGARDVLFGVLTPDEVADEALANFRGLGIVNTVTVRREASWAAAENHAAGSIDFFFFDADHERTHQHLDAWIPKVREGGVIVVDNADDPGVRMKIGRSGLQGNVEGTVYVAKL